MTTGISTSFLISWITSLEVGGVEHHAVSALMFRLDRQTDGAGAGGDSAAHAHKHRHIADGNDGLCDDRLRGKGIDGDNGVGVDILMMATSVKRPGT